MAKNTGGHVSQAAEAGAVLDTEYVGVFQQFLEHHHAEALESLLLADDDSRHCPLVVQYSEFLDASPALGNLLYFHPAKLLSLFDVAAREAQAVVFYSHKQPKSMSVKDNVHVRLSVHGSAMECPARTTIRMLESLIRLAQAHARLMFQREVRQADAIAAVVCMESSMTTSAILDGMGNALHSSFAENPDEEYTQQEQAILTKLNLLVSSASHLRPCPLSNKAKVQTV